jgi:hypothetical protein
MIAIDQIWLPASCHATIVNHAARKLDGHYVADETGERLAFGLIAGILEGDRAVVTAVFPLLRNLRQVGPYRDQMDNIIERYAVVSETENGRRGWMADPLEVLAVDELCDRRRWVRFGNYHTHRVAWPDDPRRDSCTELDRVMASDSDQWMFILSVVDRERPVLRAFYEGCNDHEATIHLIPDTVIGGCRESVPARVPRPRGERHQPHG